MESDLLQVFIEQALNTLTPREKEVIRLRFGFEDGRCRTLQEAGEELCVTEEYCVTRERIRQIENKALRKLRHPNRSRFLNPHVEVLPDFSPKSKLLCAIFGLKLPLEPPKYPCTQCGKRQLRANLPSKSGLCMQCRIASNWRECICTNCGRTFTRLKGAIKGKQNTFCSNYCQGQWLGTHYGRGKIRVCGECGGRVRTKITYVCDKCDKESEK